MMATDHVDYLVVDARDFGPDAIKRAEYLMWTGAGAHAHRRRARRADDLRAPARRRGRLRERPRLRRRLAQAVAPPW